MLAKILQQRRQELGYTQQAVAERLHVTRQAISSWETGKSYPDIPTLVTLSELYELSLDYMLKGDAGYMEQIVHETQELQELRQVKFGIYSLIAVSSIFLLLLITNGEQETPLWQVLYFGGCLLTFVAIGYLFFQLHKNQRLNRWMLIGFSLLIASLLVNFFKDLITIPYAGLIMWGTSAVGGFCAISGAIKVGEQRRKNHDS